MASKKNNSSKKEVKKATNKAGKKSPKQNEKEGQKDEQSKQITAVLIVMGILVILVLAIPAMRNSFNSFDYEGLTFTKERFGEIPVYHYYYYFEKSDGGLAKYNLYLRNDPRENYIEMNESINYPKNKRVFVSVNATGLESCPYSNLAVSGISQFLSSNEIAVKGASPDANQANASGVLQIDCGDKPNNPTILIQRGEESSIKVQNNSCYVLTIGECDEALLVSERFILKSILDAKE